MKNEPDGHLLILPQTKATNTDNRMAKTCPAERWSRSRPIGEQAHLALASHIIDTLQEVVFKTVAPQRSPFWQWQTSERYGFASNWPPPHAVYAAGLGTFGFCDGLITPRGESHALRLSSGRDQHKADTQTVERPLRALSLVHSERKMRKMHPPLPDRRP